jgi:hypothetical protein
MIFFVEMVFDDLTLAAGCFKLQPEGDARSFLPDENQIAIWQRS